MLIDQNPNKKEMTRSFQGCLTTKVRAETALTYYRSAVSIMLWPGYTRVIEVRTEKLNLGVT